MLSTFGPSGPAGACPANVAPVCPILEDGQQNVDRCVAVACRAGQHERTRDRLFFNENWCAEKRRREAGLEKVLMPCGRGIAGVNASQTDQPWCRDRQNGRDLRRMMPGLREQSPLGTKRSSSKVTQTRHAGLGRGRPSKSPFRSDFFSPFQADTGKVADPVHLPASSP